MKVYLNGTLVEKEEAKVSIFDHGFLYGDGIFEGIRLYQGCIFKLEEHLKRLEDSAKAIMIKLPWTREEIQEAVCETCRANELSDGYIRLIITRGMGDLGLNPKTCDSPQLFIIADKIELYPNSFYEEGLKIATVPTRRISCSALPPMIKSLNYLNNILAKIEAQQQGCLEALMLNEKGEVAECSGDNVFIVTDNTLMTPPVYAGSLNGITRKTVIDLARDAGIQVVETNLTRYDIWVADEFFLTGTAAEVIPVIELDGRSIGNGKPGTMTTQLRDLFLQQVTKNGFEL